MSQMSNACRFALALFIALFWSLIALVTKDWTIVAAVFIITGLFAFCVLGAFKPRDYCYKDKSK